VPFTLYEIPAGDYNLYAFVAGWNAYAEGSVHVEGSGNRPETPQRVELLSQPAHFARGSVRAANGSPAGAAIELEHPTWPPEVEKLWSSRIASDGRFEQLLGAETSCAARLARDGKLVLVQLHAGDGAELVIP
jgi:hypothetical protein